jgi:CRISPR-associated protein Csb2
MQLRLTQARRTSGFVHSVLLLAIRFHDARYHGAGDWPPAPARLFQALVASAARGGCLSEGDVAALCWLEGLPPPVIATPPVRRGTGLITYVPNNDLDAVGGHPIRIGEIRAGKLIQPLLFDAEVPLIYAWTIADGEAHLPALIALADRLYQLGRGVDMAWATAEAVDAATAEARLAAHTGPKHRPTGAGNGGSLLASPQPGSLASLIARHSAQATRFQPGERKGTTLFVQPPKARFRMVPYDCPPARLLFDLRAGSAFAPWPLHRAAALIEMLRDEAARRLQAAQPDRLATIERLLVGRGASPADIALRPRLIPLPSIGFVHADRAIRRVLLEVPPDSPLSPVELRAALSGLPLHVDPATGEIQSDARLVPAAEETMLRHYGLREESQPARLWRSVTPMALPGGPFRSGHTGSARLAGEAARAIAVRHALRHAGLTQQVTTIRVQREPFAGRGERAEAFVHEPRFLAAALCHVELRFAEPRRGPLILGNGRWLGLGLFAPVAEHPPMFTLCIMGGLAAGADAAPALASALRRAVMARVRDCTGSDRLDAFFTGHAADGAPLRDGNHRHLAFAFDPERRRLLVIAPHAFEGRPVGLRERQHLATLDTALAGLAELRAGPAGLLRLQPADVGQDDDPLLVKSTSWRSITPYAPTRHAKSLAPVEAIAEDVRRECRRRGWPEPCCEVLDFKVGPRGSLTATLHLHFAVARSGPILLGRTAHAGGGLFRACP